MSQVMKSKIVLTHNIIQIHNNIQYECEEYST